MAGRKRTTVSCRSTPHRLKKRCATRITATPLHANVPPRPTPRIKSKEKEEIETTRDEYWARPLPTSPAPSPPRPHEICPILNCTLVGTPHETQVFTYRKLYNENNETLRDALGRETAGRHSFPASEFKRDRSYMTPSARAKKAHGIEYWPDPPFKSSGDSVDGEHSMYVKYFERERSSISLTPPSREPARVHTTGGRQVVRRPLRLFANENGVGDGGMERDYEDGDDGSTIEQEKEQSLVHTAIGAQGDTASKSSYRKRRATKTPQVKARRRLNFTCGSVKSDGVRTLGSSREELIEDEEDENEEVEDGSDEPEREISYGMQSYLENNDDVEGGDPNKTLEDIFVHTPIGVRGETASKSTSRKRRTSKDTVAKSRRSFYTGSVESDRVRVMTSPEEEEMGEEEEENERDEEKMEDEEKENEGDDYGFDEPEEDGDMMIVEDGDPNKTLQEEKEESGEEEEGLGGEKMEESIELRVERSKERGDDNSVRVDGRDGEDEEEEVVEVEEEDDDDMRESLIEEDVEQIDAIMNDPIEEESIQDDELSDHTNTSRQEISESEEEDDNSDVMEKSAHSRSSVCDISLIDTTLTKLESVVDSIVDEDLRRMLAVCNQDNVTDMDELMATVATADKVGEGSFADAYLVKRDWDEEKKVFKIIALRTGKNDEDEMDEKEENVEGGKKEEDARAVLGELIISKDLTLLGRSGRNFTTAFAKLYQAKVIQGKFPPLLSDAWDRFYENDDDAIDDVNPKEYGEQQLFLVLECEYGGLSLKKFPFSSLLEIVSVYCQTALAMAVAESEFKFEHRDLHEDNVLVKRTEDGVIEFTFDCEEEKGTRGGNHKAIRVPTHGVKTTIIDFTLSRITRKTGRGHSMEEINVYHELTHEQCNQKAEAEQYVVYNKMEKLTQGVWEKYTPKSNVLWMRMQINWIIKENCNPRSELNKKRLETTRTRRTLKSDKKQEKKQSKKKSVDNRKSGVYEERTELSGATWMKKLKDGESIIRTLKSFSKGILKFNSAVDIVTSKEFESLLDLLVQ